MLTDSQLADIGITDGYDRSKILKAIKNLLNNSLYCSRKNPIHSSSSSSSSRNNNNVTKFKSQMEEKSQGSLDKSVDDWLQFINSGTSQTRKNAKKKKRRRKSTKKTSTLKETRENVMQQLEKEIEEGLLPKENKKKSIPSAPTKTMTNKGKNAIRNNNNNNNHKLDISPHLYALDNGNWPVNNDDFDTFELDTFDAEVEAFRKRLEAASQETSSYSIFSSID